MLLKIIGFILLIAGFWIAKNCADISDYQKPKLRNLEILIGFIFIIIGTIMIIFA